MTIHLLGHCMSKQGNLIRRKRLSIVDLLIIIGCFVKKKIAFSGWKNAELVSTRSTILILPL
jgi:hypothetical protein